MNSLKLLLIFYIVTIYSCKETVKITNLNIPSYQIDLDKATTHSVYDIFSKIEVIPLQTPDSIVFGGMNFTVYKNNIFYWDQRQDIVLCFDLQGNYKYTINSKGRGPREYTHIHKIYVDPFHDHFMILDYFTGILKYDLSGKFINKIRFPEGLIVNNFSVINQDTILYMTQNANDGDNRILHYVSLETKKIIGSWYKEDAIYPVNETFNHHNTATHYCIAKEPYIYNVGQYPPTPVLYWDFGKYNYDYQTLNVPSAKNKKQVNQIQRSWLYNNCPWLLNESIERNNYIYTSLTFNKGGDYAKKIKAPLYRIFLNKSTGIYQVVNKFKEGQILSGFSNFTEDAVYTAIEKSYLEECINSQYLTPENQKIIQNLSEDANPVILKYSLK